MTPPPPPLRVPWRGEGPRLDPALDDAPLRGARDALGQGRWSDVRTLLIDTGTDWDLRGHRLAALAQASGSESWARDWQLTEPDNADAAVLVACAAAHAAAEGKGSRNAARQAVAEAADAAPEDPTPWLAALLLARHTGGLTDSRAAFDEVVARHPAHHHAHHLMLAALADTHPGTEIYDFAAERVAAAPAGSRMVLLPVVAHAELFRAHTASAVTPAGDAGPHWQSRHAQHLVRVGFDWWLQWDAADRHPRRLIDLNFLAYAKFHEGRMAEAAALFQRVDSHVTQAPWSYGGGDPRKAFRAAARAAHGSS